MGKKRKILVCFKVTNELDTVLEEDWQNGTDGNIDLSYTRRSLGCYDEAALEQGLRLADQMRAAGEEVEITALTVADEAAEDICKGLYAVKYDNVVCLECGEDLRFCPERVALEISRFVRQNHGFDVIIMGQQASVGDYGKMHWLVGEFLSFPTVTQVRELEFHSEGIWAISESEGWERRYLTDKSVVFAIGNAKYPYLRVATLREKLASSKKQILKIEICKDETCEGISYGEPVLFSREKTDRKCCWIKGENVKEKAEDLYKSLKEAGAL